MDTRGQRGFWMLGAGKIHKFPFVLKNVHFPKIFQFLEKQFSILLPKFLTTCFFYSFTKIFEFFPKLQFVSQNFRRAVF